MLMSDDDFRRDYLVLDTFPVYWSGWECDATGWICEDRSGYTVIILSNHGAKYVANESEVVELAEEWQTAAMTLVKAVEMARTRNDCRTAWMAKKGVSQ